MTSIWDTIGQIYNYVFDELSHPRTKHNVLVRSPLPILTVLILYNLFCIKIGPMLMKNRPPYKLTTILRLYNIFQILISLYVVHEGSSYIFSGYFNYQCEGPDEVFSEEMRERVLRAGEIYCLLKIVDLLDTVFFVLRKSDRQITFLHLYHHTFMPLACWIGYKYSPGGSPAVIVSLNSLVHAFMYTYYLISGMGPQYQKYLWWKKYLTIMQIVQFVVYLILFFNSLFYTCSLPTAIKVLGVIEACAFIYMFSMFYYRSYINVQSKKPGINKQTTSNGTGKSNNHSVNDKLNIKKKK